MFGRSVLPSCDPCVFSPSLFLPLHVRASDIKKHAHLNSDLVNVYFPALCMSDLPYISSTYWNDAFCLTVLLKWRSKGRRVGGWVEWTSHRIHSPPWCPSTLPQSTPRLITLEHGGSWIFRSVHCLLLCSKDQCVPSACEHTLISLLLYQPVCWDSKGQSSEALLALLMTHCSEV